MAGHVVLAPAHPAEVRDPIVAVVQTFALRIECAGYNISVGVQMTRHWSLTDRISERRSQMDKLITDFGSFVDAFDKSRTYTGPGIYFHVNAMAARRTHTSVADAMTDDRFMDYMYATLTSWGLHRMGPGYTKLADIRDLKSSLQRQVGPIERLARVRLEEVSEDQVDDLAASVWGILQELRVGIGRTLLVANSKALHHVLPDLVPPIDRNYTLNFFLGRPYIRRGRDADYFKALFPLFWEIAVSCQAAIHERIIDPPTGMNTSVTKVIDNAILGFMPLQQAG